ncbi:MAG: NAD(P)(+) transhydrogenase (Re/Si-specific) subunit beta [Candidatus Marinimicrobia bacterium]|nr:NAD(P)(+) transhydrogenase (Re/Si-specific) subunit beta [Candidatus Neomarinimicrobiota bacterium]MCF7828361.1 NAD(P)(+) transhydrogenase (Re/Si-specific) subunit beta [Candidatus Neomarinimicrobiota bacterium]MCF7881046.1 NAD(P)(+) transhydrogenase (Re/Si-specific) subunit beta [Candidatus Neomarinimicrobiota bacterium]
MDQLTTQELVTKLLYLLSIVFFIFGLKDLGSPKTARRGNLFASLGMLIAVVVTLFHQDIISYTWIIVGLVGGGLLGGVAARTVKMTDMPQMVAIFNGFGGGASTLVALAEYYHLMDESALVAGGQTEITIAISIIIGTITFFGSVVAFTKLQGLVRGAPIVFPFHNGMNGLFILATVVIAVLGVITPMNPIYFYIVLAMMALLGVTMVIPIGGADMPVVISLLNSFSGLAASATGFVLMNEVLIVSGALVGAAGLILTFLMCDAMNRSLYNVLFGAVGTDGGGGGGPQDKNVTAYTATDAMVLLENANKVIIVPGYGLAVAQAQHVLQEMVELLQETGVKVMFGIHPVAGRMPGHMNVLLAEANTPYDLLMDLDEINDEFQSADVALVVGANDVTNPAARTETESPIYGMPILNVDQAERVMIIKRSLSPGFAGVDNPLFYEDKTMMLFGDAKKMVTNIVSLLKEA